MTDKNTVVTRLGSEEKVTDETSVPFLHIDGEAEDPISLEGFGPGLYAYVMLPSIHGPARPYDPILLAKAFTHDPRNPLTREEIPFLVRAKVEWYAYLKERFGAILRDAPIGAPIKELCSTGEGKEILYSCFEPQVLPFYHSELNRHEAEALLTTPGQWLIRPSSVKSTKTSKLTGGEAFVFVVSTNTKGIERSDGIPRDFAHCLFIHFYGLGTYQFVGESGFSLESWTPPIDTTKNWNFSLGDLFNGEEAPLRWCNFTQAIICTSPKDVRFNPYCYA